MLAIRGPTSQAPRAGAAGDLLDACCSVASCWLARLTFAAYPDAATSRPIVPAHIRVPIFYRCRDRISPGNRPRQRAMLRTREHFHAVTAAAAAVQEASMRACF